MPTEPSLTPSESLPLAQESDVDNYVARIARIAQEYEFGSFSVGTHLRMDLPPEQALEVRRDLNARVTRAVCRVFPDRAVSPDDPDMAFLLHYPGRWVKSIPTPVFVYGRYCKYTRDLPQARWLCLSCGGRGCDRCGGTGRIRVNSVEEIIATPLLAAMRAEGSKMHATGRQDIDVRMLGTGRPFAIELVNARRRTADLDAIRSSINEQGTVAVSPLSFVGREIVRAVDTARADKTYRAIVRAVRPIDPAELDGLSKLKTLIDQQTPRRVAGRRADLVRRRSVKELTAKALDDARVFEMVIRTETGTYIKELISGDEGRTRPSVAEVLQTPCVCDELDVLAVHFDPFSGDSA